MHSYLAVSLLVLYHFVSLSLAVTQPEWDLDISEGGRSKLSLNLNCPNLPPRTCRDVKTNESYAVVTLADGYEVLCDTKTDGGGWIVIQRRINADVDFYRNWTDYKYGFGNINGNFWFGNEKIHRLTFLRRYKLRIDITYNNTRYYANYDSFRLFGEGEKYKLEVGGYSGNAGDSLATQNGQSFSTADNDNDAYSGNCASLYHGAWWHKTCHTSNLNGLWASKTYAVGLTWFTITGYYDSATSTEIKIKPVA